MVVNVDSSSSWYRTFKFMCDELKEECNIPRDYKKNEDTDAHAHVVFSVCDMFPQGAVTLRHLTEQDGNALRCRAMEHAERFLGFFPRRVMGHWGWELIRTDELDYMWELMIPELKEMKRETKEILDGTNL